MRQALRSWTSSRGPSRPGKGEGIGDHGHELEAPLVMICDAIEKAGRSRIAIPPAKLSAMRRCCSRLLEMIDKLLELPPFDARQLDVGRKSEGFEDRIKRLIGLHLHEDTFDVAALAKITPLSRAQLHRRLMAASGCSPSELIRALRLEHARELIAQPEVTITEIAYAVGFTSVDGFTRAFHHRYGLTPSEFRRRSVHFDDPSR
jgi:AraC-like DNA-binding protein